MGRAGYVPGTHKKSCAGEVQDTGRGLSVLAASALAGNHGRRPDHETDGKHPKINNDE